MSPPPSMRSRQGRAVDHRRSLPDRDARSERTREGANGALLFNVSAPDGGCARKSAAPMLFMWRRSRAMLADGLTQYLVWSSGANGCLIKGSHPNDELLAQAYRRAAKKFGAKIVEETHL